MLLLREGGGCDMLPDGLQSKTVALVPGCLRIPSLKLAPARAFCWEDCICSCPCLLSFVASLCDSVRLTRKTIRSGRLGGSSGR